MPIKLGCKYAKKQLERVEEHRAHCSDPACPAREASTLGPVYECDCGIRVRMREALVYDVDGSAGLHTCKSAGSDFYASGLGEALKRLTLWLAEER
jgi:hypothetical protein